MTPIFSPIAINESSDNVANLQTALSIILPAIGFTDFKLSAAEIEARRPFDGTLTGIKILREKFPDANNPDLLPNLLVDELMAKLINGFLKKIITIKGKLTDSNGQSLPGNTLLISEFDIDQTVEMGAATTNADGVFSFSFLYESKLREGDGKTNPDLLFKVRGSFGQLLSAMALTRNADAVFVIENGVETVVPRLAASEKSPVVLMNCPPEIEVRIVVITAQSDLTEFERLLIQLQPFIRNIGFADLKEDDQNFHISFLNKETGIQKSIIENLKDAFVNERDSNLAAWAFFGLSSTPLLISEWNNKTPEEFIALLQTFKPANTTEDINALAEKLRAYAKNTAVKATVQDYKSSVGNLLAPIFQTSSQLDLFLEQYTRHEGSTEEFWKGMEQNTMFSQDVPKIQLNLQLSQLTLGNTGLVQSLQDKGINDTRQLVNLNNEDWQTLVGLHPEGIPTHIIGGTVQERANIYANELQILVETAFPTEVIKKSAASEGVVKFLDLNPDFDFTKTPVETYLHSKGEAALQEIDNRDAIINEMRQTQRLYAITSSATDMQMLQKQGFNSAYQISNMSLADFSQTMSGKIKLETAGLYHAKATAITEATTMLHLQLRELGIATLPSSVGTRANLPAVLPTWQNLFGQVETCECEHCRSVYSPAAYFVDLLHVLLGKNDGKARKELFRRRPDLKYTKLSCEHTDTLIPYIDLVNEILETYVAQSHIGDGDADTHAQDATNDTSVFSEPELMANPQHPKSKSQDDADEAYRLVSAATYPISLPFDLALETARSFLAAQNSSRYELMQNFGAPQSDAAIAESLGLSELEFNILTGKDQIIVAGQLVEPGWNIEQDFFGYLPTELPIIVNALGEQLKPVQEFLSRTGIAYTDLVELAGSGFLNPVKTIGLTFNPAIKAAIPAKDLDNWEAAHLCDLSVMVMIHNDLSPLTQPELAKFSRFIRLWKRLGCTIGDLDLMLSVLGTEFSSALLKDFSALWKFRHTWNLSAEQSAALVSTIPTGTENSLYKRLFLNKAILQIDDKFGLNNDGSELVNVAESISDHKAAIQAAVQITTQDLNDIARSANINIVDANTLTLANLSLIYRFKLVAKINNLTVHELILLLPFAEHQQFNTIAALTENQLFFAKLKRNGLKAAAITYLFSGFAEPGSTLPPKTEIINKSATDLREGLIKITQSTTPPDAIISAGFLKGQLGLLFDEKDADKLIGILDGSNIKADPDKPLQTINKLSIGNMKSDFDFLQSPPVIKEYEGILASYLSAGDADNISNATNAADRFSLFWQAVSIRLVTLQKDTFTQQHLVAQFKMNADLAVFVYRDLSKSLLGVEFGPTIQFDEFTMAFIRLFKFMWLVNKLKLSAKELAYFQKNGAAFGNFNWSDFTAKQLKSWLRLADYVTLRNTLPVSNVSLISVFETAQTPGGDISKTIIDLTGYDLTNVSHFVSKRPTSVFTTEEVLLVLQSQIAISQAIGVNIAKLEEWSGHTIDNVQAQDIKRTLKANYNNEAWVDISSQVHNKLRNQQRDALAAYLLQKPGIKSLKMSTLNDLYGYFLIDVEMDAVMKTSRLKQAISSVQLFVQRCVLNLESFVLPLDIDPKQWSWMKYYRVWEANRKVFLYPENWIEPELRDGKSPFFKELESELMQSEITNDSVEKAMVNYLHKLDEVARLDICGMYEDQEGQELHVFGRTFNSPHQYYYRKLNLSNHEWTAWEKVQLDIQGNDEGLNPGVHLIPVVWNRRLYLFWPLFVRKVDKELLKSETNKFNQLHDRWKDDYTIALKKYNDQQEFNKKNNLGSTGQMPVPQPEPVFDESIAAYWEIHLSWSEYKQKSWSTKKVSQSFVKSLVATFYTDKTNTSFLFSRIDLHKFKCTISSTNNLVIEVSHDIAVVIPGNNYFNENSIFRTQKIDEINPPQNVYSIGYFSLDGLGSTINATTYEYGVLQVQDDVKDSWVEYQKSRLFTNSSQLFLKQKPQVIFNKLATNNIQILPTNVRNGNELYKFFLQDSERNYYVEPRQEWHFNALASLKDKQYAAIPYQHSQKNILVIPLARLNNINPVPDTIQLPSLKEVNALVDSGKISSSASLAMRNQMQITRPSATVQKKFASAANVIGSKYLGDIALKRAVTKLDFQPFFHKYIVEFIRALNKSGIDGLLTPGNQIMTDQYWVSISGNPIKRFLHSNFEQNYQPNTDIVSTPYPTEDIDFRINGAYSIYNWELFFHIPMLMANRLSKNQKFEEAMRWYHFIFNPTTHDTETSAKRYWQVLPLRNTPAETLDVLMQQLNNSAGDSRRRDLETAIEAWRSNPFNPHLVARMRLIAYQKNVLMKYLDNLIAWADNLFQQDTMENINQATQLYVLAAVLLGKRPEKVTPGIKVEAKTYQELETAGLNAFSNAQVMMETTFPFFNLQDVQSNTEGNTPVLSSTVPVNYFGLPGNPKLLAYWDTIADRLFKIRHSLNIEGMERQLALFEPPIDPALLVQATAKGLDISSVLADLNAPLPHYRFVYIIQKALEICSELKSLGNTLLSVLEKKDNEALSKMRTEQETTLLNLSRIVKQFQIKESLANREGLEKTRDVTQHRADFYKLLLANGLNEGEKEQQVLSALSTVFSLYSQELNMAASSATLAPDPGLGQHAQGMASGASTNQKLTGGDKTAKALSAFGSFFTMLSTMTSYGASVAQTNAGYQRRADDWKQQNELAEKELLQIDKQILATTIRESVADQELTNLEQQIDNACQVEDFYRNKYTQEELYGWIQGEISTVYFQCYQLAYDLAKKAEKTYRFELGIPESNFIQFGIWDSFRKGLMSGERLYLSLKQMEKAYMDQNRREYELTKHISLLQHFPLALLQLKASDSCIIELPESLFDADYPGHYMRRIKNMSISIPCVVGPYTSINCTLSLLSSSIRSKNILKGDKYKRDSENEDDRFVDQLGAIQSVATSHAQNDSGMFELNFRDERYLPFEYSGAISRWKIELPHETNAFDFSTLSDVILHLKYTARDGGKSLKNEAQKVLPKETEVLLTVKHHFANEWYQYTQQNKGKAVSEMSKLELLVTQEKLPFFARNSTIQDTTSKAFTFKKSGEDSFAKIVSDITVDGMNLSFKPTDKIDNIEDVFLILKLQKP